MLHAPIAGPRLACNHFSQGRIKTDLPVVPRKLEYYREGGSDKHIRDIAGIMEVSGHQIAFNELEEKIMRLGLEKEWEKAKDFVSK